MPAYERRVLPSERVFNSQHPLWIAVAFIPKYCACRPGCSLPIHCHPMSVRAIEPVCLDKLLELTYSAVINRAVSLNTQTHLQIAVTVIAIFSKSACQPSFHFHHWRDRGSSDEPLNFLEKIHDIEARKLDNGENGMMKLQ